MLQTSQSTTKLELKEIGTRQEEESIENDESDIEDGNALQQLTRAMSIKLDSQQSQYVKFFKPNVKLCLVIGNSDYSTVRNHTNKGFSDLPAAEVDADNFARKILEYGFEPENVQMQKQVNLKQMQNLINDYRKTLNKNFYDDSMKTLLVIYYAGHGVMYMNQNNIVVVEEEKKN